ncbi:MFS transporter [Roseibium sp.]|uniref:MFS transporter n=1 Tax=Roseibium sp. TaxID=1936156 RepID=UPI003A973E97
MTELEPDVEPKKAWRRIPRSIWVLGFVSMLMDISSEMIHVLLPVYLVSVLGASAVTVGFIEGMAEATASFTKVFSGGLSDWLRKRKSLVLIGYSLAAITKPIFPLAQSVDWIIGARFVDRIGKGIRGAPRNALIADIAPPDLRGASFGLRQSLDTIGAFVGPILVMLLMIAFAGSYEAVFWIAVIPAFLAVALIVFAVREPEDGFDKQSRRTNPISRRELAQLTPAYWGALVLAFVIALSRFSEAFLVLKGQDLGLAVMFVPMVYVVMNIAYAISAYPAGSLSDTAGRKGLLAVGLGFLIAADLALALVPGLAGLALGTILWGFHLGFTSGVLDALVSDHAPRHLRGTAFGLFNLVNGAGLLLASLIAGILWDQVGPSGTFLAGGALATLSLIGLPLLISKAVNGPKRDKTSGT